MKVRFRGCAIICGAFLLTAAAFAADSPIPHKAAAKEHKSKSKQTQTKAFAEVRDGVRVAIDPATRQLRAPDASETARMNAAAGPRGAYPERVIQLRNGAIALVATPDHHDYATASVAADGTVSFKCAPANAAQSSKETADVR